MKKVKYLLSVIFAIFMLVACGEKKEEAKTEAPVELKKVDFLLDWVPNTNHTGCLLYTSPSPRDTERSRMPSSA